MKKILIVSLSVLCLCLSACAKQSEIITTEEIIKVPEETVKKSTYEVSEEEYHAAFDSEHLGNVYFEILDSTGYYEVKVAENIVAIENVTKANTTTIYTFKDDGLTITKISGNEESEVEEIEGQHDMHDFLLNLITGEEEAFNHYEKFAYDEENKSYKYESDETKISIKFKDGFLNEIDRDNTDRTYAQIYFYSYNDVSFDWVIE